MKFLYLCYLSLFIVSIYNINVISCSYNHRPVIGVLDQPTIEESNCNLTRFGEKYIVSSYVKLIESSGARVVPIPFDASKEKLTEIFKTVNGILLPGGDADFTPKKTKLYHAVDVLFNLTIEANDHGDYFPIIGLCQGFEILMVRIAGGNCSVLDFDYDAQNLSLPLDFTNNARDSKMWRYASDTIFNLFQSKPMTYNAHNNGIKPVTAANNDKISSFIDVLSTNVDRNNKPFVSSFEAKKYPIFGLQFHPSRPSFEWVSTENLNHSLDAIISMDYIARFLYGETRNNTHTYSNDSPAKLIYNYKPEYTGKPNLCPIFEQSYFFNYTF